MADMITALAMVVMAVVMVVATRITDMKLVDIATGTLPRAMTIVRPKIGRPGFSDFLESDEFRSLSSSLYF
jgi:hypothetical protein